LKKSDLRIKYKQFRASLSKDKLEYLSLDIANQCLNLHIWKASFYHIYLPITNQNEVNTEYLLNILAGKDKNIIVSKSDFKTLRLQHFLLTDATVFKTNKFGIPEPLNGIEINPAQIEVVFVPLLAYDLKGHRVGYGKGFYDRFLSQCQPQTIKVGLSFFQPELEIIPFDETDIKLDYCVTPQNILVFNQ